MSNKSIMLSIFLVLVVVFISCSKDDEDNTINALFVGEWEHLEYPFNDVVFMIRLGFQEDGVFKADSWEISFGISKPSLNDEGYGLNKEQATALIRSKTWSNDASIGKWAIDGESLKVTADFFENDYQAVSYSFVGGELIIPVFGENLVFTKL
jgi:hypothetical protein